MQHLLRDLPHPHYVSSPYAAYRPPNAVDSLGCGHSFCQNCLVPYLERAQDCPSCHRLIDVYPVRNHALEHILLLLTNTENRTNGAKI